MRPRSSSLVALALAAAALIGSRANVAAQPQRCRTYSAAESRVFSTGGGATQVCDFSPATYLYTCTMDLRILGGRRVVSVRQYASVIDFVDEVQIVPGLSRAKLGSTIYSPSGTGAQNARITFDYDAQRRQTDMIFQFADGHTVKTMYTSWDALGRPTAHLTSGQAFKYTYDDKARTMTIAGPGGLQEHKFDANGNLVREVDAPAVGPSSTTTVTITKTATVCPKPAGS